MDRGSAVELIEAAAARAERRRRVASLVSDDALASLVDLDNPALARRIVDDPVGGEEAFRRLLHRQNLPDPGEASDDEIALFASLAGADRPDTPVALGLPYAIAELGPAFRRDALSDYVAAFGEERVERALQCVAEVQVFARAGAARREAAEVAAIGQGCLGLWGGRRLGVLAALWQRLAPAAPTPVEEALALPLADLVLGGAAPTPEATR
jgi:hypothetical protein